MVYLFMNVYIYIDCLLFFVLNILAFLNVISVAVRDDYNRFFLMKNMALNSYSFVCNTHLRKEGYLLVTGRCKFQQTINIINICLIFGGKNNGLVQGHARRTGRNICLQK